MPYKLSDDGLCVLDADGKELKCYDNKADAKAYLGALMANVDDASKRLKAILYRQTEVQYNPVSPNTGIEQCANCRFFCPSGMYSGYIGDSDVSPPYCAIVEPFPYSILPTGYCVKWEAIPPDVIEPQPMEVVIVDEKPDVSVEVEVETEAPEIRGYIAPPPVKAGMVKQLFGMKDPPGVIIYRSESGKRRALHITSNGYKDREKEHVAQKALEEYVESQYKDGQWAGDNALDFWHESAIGDIGDIIAAAMIGGFLVEVSEERTDSPIAVKIWDYWQKTAMDNSVNWGTSHEFRARQVGDTYEKIKKKKTSVLEKSAAANIYTYSGVVPMNEVAAKHLNKALGLEDADKILREQGINALNEALRKSGERAKARNHKKEDMADKPDEEKADTVAIDFTPLLTALMEAMGMQEETVTEAARGLKELTDRLDTQKKATDTTASDLKAARAELAALTRWRDDFLKSTPRGASSAVETRLRGNEEQAAKEAIEKRTTEFDPAFPGMNVPLKGNGANNGKD